MEYNKNFTISISLPRQCLKQINVLSRKDGGKGFFLDDVEVWSMDDVERSFSPNQPHNTIDIAMGVSDEGVREINKRMLLCELRFNYKTPGNIKKSDLEKKISCTKDLLGSERIEPKVYFLFSSDKIQQARSIFERNLYSFGSLKGLRIVMSEKDFAQLLSIVK